MIAKKVILEFPLSKKQRKVYENVILFSDNKEVFITGEIGTIKIFDISFYSISREWISFKGFIMNSKLLFEKIELHILQEKDKS